MGRNTLKSVAVELLDTNGNTTVLDFCCDEDFQWFLHNEGDHVIEYKYI